MDEVSKPQENRTDREQIVCAHCGDSVPGLVPVETGMKLRLKEAGQTSVPDEVCSGCFQIMSNLATSGAALKAEQLAKVNNRLVLWKNRVQLVRQGKGYLNDKNFGDAAVAFEKYIRVLEIVYECGPGELSADMFKKNSSMQEITVVTSVYWDLLRIYDTNEVYRDRQMKAAKKLAEFVRFSPIFAQIIRKAQSQTLSARNPAAFKTFLLEANAARPRCFIATAAFDNPHAWQVQTLCYLRDERLLKTKSGRAFVALYYRFSPTVAAWLDRHANAKPPVRWLLSLLASQIRAAKSLESPPMNAPFLPNGAKQRNSTQQSVSNLS